MLKKSLVAVSLASLVYSAAFSQAKLLEKVEKKGTEIVIPYEKYVLPNGLTIVVHEDHSDPIVYCDVTYHVGSDREEAGRSGFAHFYEHMMFQGSDHVADEEHFKIVSEAGGTLNGTTNSDRTNYFETMPSNYLETAIWLEADRMGFLLDAVTQQKFEVQRATVKNERGQRVDNQPYGRLFETLSLGLYPKGHPYNWPTIGWMDDLDRATLQDLKNFFLRWYGPNNAVLTVAGDVTPQQVIKLAEKYFGSIPRGPEVADLPAMPVQIESDRYIAYEDNIRFPLLAMAFPTVENYSADEAPLDVLSDILGGGKNSILYKNLVKNQMALQAQASNPCSELSGIFMFTVLPFPGKTLVDMEAKVREAIAEFETRGVTDDDLKKYKATREADIIKSLASVQGKGAQLAAFQTFTGNPNYIQKELDRYLKVTKEDVMRVYNKYLKGKSAVILSIYPKGKPEMVAKPSNFKLEKTPVPEVMGNATAGLSYNKPKDNFDRSKHPASGVTPDVKVPALWRDKFTNGMKVIGTQNTELPVVSMQLTIDCGHKMSQLDMSKAGIAQLLSSMLNEATTKSSAEDIERKLELLGSSIDITTDRTSINVAVSSLTKNLDATLALLQERLFSPKFDPKDFERLKKQQLELIANQATQAPTVANNVFSKVLYGSESIYSIPLIGTEKTVESITLDDVKNYYNKFFSPNITSLVVVGDIKKEQVLPKLQFLKDWTSKNVAVAKLPKAPDAGKTKIYLVDKENAPQTEVRVGYVTDMAYDVDGDYYKSGLMNYTLGGAFNSRINLNLREKKGWTYGARSGFNSDQDGGVFSVSGGFKESATDSTVIEIMKDLKNYASGGITDEELAFTKSSIGQNDALKYETPGQKAVFLKRIITYNLPDNYVEKQNAILKNITKEEIAALAKKRLPSETMVITAVGDKAKHMDALKKLGYEVVELDKEGNPVTAGGVMTKKTTVKLTISGTSVEMPIEVNGAGKTAALDPMAAGEIKLSMKEAEAMMKAGKLNKDDVNGGKLSDGGEITIKSMKLGGKEVNNVKAKVSSSQEQAIALGPQALKLFGKITPDMPNQSLIIE